MRYILLSYSIDENTPLYGNTAKPRIMAHSRISDGDSSNTAILSVHNHTGTHVDAPRHFIDEGKTISEYTLDELTFKNPVVIDCPKDSAELITPEDIRHASHLLQKSDCLLLRTGFGQFRGEEKYRMHNPGIAPDTILWIRGKYPNILCVGIDIISISSYQHRAVGREAHKAAFVVESGLGEPLLLIEDMNLDVLSGSELKCIVVFPWQVNNIDSAPCSVLAEIE